MTTAPPEKENSQEPRVVRPWPRWEPKPNAYAGSLHTPPQKFGQLKRQPAKPYVLAKVRR
jgi:hypothetical protein